MKLNALRGSLTAVMLAAAALAGCAPVPLLPAEVANGDTDLLLGGIAALPAAPGPPGVAPDAPTAATPQSDAAARALRAADAWGEATRLMNLPFGDPRKRDMFLVLCGAGDDSACVMASAARERIYR